VHVLLIPSWYATRDNPVWGSFFREQAHSLARAGHRVGVIAPRMRSIRDLPAGLAGAARGVEFEDDLGVPTYRVEGAQLLPGLARGNDRAWVSAGRRLFARYVAEQGTPDILHAHAMFMGGVIGGELAREHGVPLVITEHSTVYQRRAIPAFQIEEARAALATAAALLVVSPNLGEEMRRVLGDVRKEARWVPNVVDNAFLDAELRSSREPGPFRFLNVAFLHEKKAHADLLAAFAERFAGDADVQLRIGGDGEERDRLRSLADALGIAKQVVWLGPLSREQVLAEMRAADAFVLASRIETFGVVVAEALASGLPVVATRSGGPECIVGDGDGLLVEPGDVSALGEAMARLRETASSYDADGLRRRCQERFGEAALIRELDDVYAAAVGGGDQA
jgi:teichuronic acid biosynthesis glycosyltransferase TuaC